MGSRSIDITGASVQLAQCDSVSCGNRQNEGPVHVGRVFGEEFLWSACCE